MRVVAKYIMLTCVIVTSVRLFGAQEVPAAQVVSAMSQAKPEQAVPAQPEAAPQQVPAAGVPSVQVTLGSPSVAPAPQSQPVLTEPVVIQPQAKSAADEKEEDVQGITTVDLDEPQGNWLFKRMWWQRGQSQYEKTKALVDMIMESRMAFFSKRTEWDKTIFDPFYMEIGIGRGVLEELVANVLTELNNERAHQGQLDEAERDLVVALQSEKATLEQLQKDIKKINDIDGAVDKAISTLIEQINVARGYEKQSWQNFKQIAQELSDKKARELFYSMQTHWQNINQVADYIQQPFLQYFDQLGKLAQETTAKVSDTMKALKEKGVDFKKQWQVLEEKNRQDQLKKEHQEGFEQGQQAAQKEERGFVGSIIGAIGDGISMVWNLIKSGAQSVWGFTFGRFFGASPAATTLPDMPQVAPPITQTAAMSDKITTQASATN